MQVILITQYYKVNTNDINYDKPRQMEIDYCLLKNCQNKYISEIHLLVEKIYDITNIIPTEYINKIKQINIGKRLTYLDAFTYYNKFLLDKICILANADIYMDDSLYILEHINFNFDIFLCLNRYEVHSEKDNKPPMLHGTEQDISSVVKYMKPYEPAHNSMDAWIWKTNKINLLLNTKYDFMLGILGCDNYLSKLLFEDKYILLNPSYLIAINHYDMLSSITNEYGIIKGRVSFKKNITIGTIKDYIFLQNISDIPDKYTTQINNCTSLENIFNLKEYNVNIKNTSIEKNVELIQLKESQIKSCYESNDLQHFIQFNFEQSEKIAYIDIQGKQSYVKKIKILYSASDINSNTYVYEDETEGILIPNRDYIKRIYFKEPIYCNIMRILILEYEKSPVIKYNIYKIKDIIGKKEEYELITLQPCQIQKTNEYIQYNFENMYNIRMIDFSDNIYDNVKIEYIYDNPKTDVIILNNINIECVKFRIYLNTNTIPKLYCKKVERYNIYKDMILKINLNNFIYSTYADYSVYKLINNDIKISYTAPISDIMLYYDRDLKIKELYKTFNDYYEYVKKHNNDDNIVMDKKEGITLFICVMNRTENIISNINSWLKQSINELLIIDWSSDIEFYDIINSYNDSRIKYIRVENEEKYIRTYAQNLGLLLCNYNKICKLDCDIILSDNFFENHILNDNMFYVGDYLCARNDNERYVHGNIYMHTYDFMRVNGYNELITTYGWEDSDFTIRLLLLGLQKRLFNLDMIYHTPHSNLLRTININSMASPEILIRANKMMIENLPLWNNIYKKQEYNIIKNNENYYIVERINKIETEGIVNYFDNILRNNISMIKKSIPRKKIDIKATIGKYNIFMYIHMQYKNQSVYSNVNDYFNNNITMLLNNYTNNTNTIDYSYYKEFNISTINMILDIMHDEYYVPPFRLILCGEKYNNYGIHRYGWNKVMTNFLKQAYCETNKFYYKYSDFEWVSYANNNNVDTYEDSIIFYVENKNCNYNKMKNIIFNDWLEKRYIWGTDNSSIYNNNFISFIHDPPCNDNMFLHKMNRDNKSILEKNEKFLQDKSKLKILVTLSEYHKNYITKNIDINTNIISLQHPLELESNKYCFNFDKFINNDKKKLYMIGAWLRKYDTFAKIKYDKVIVMKKTNDNYVKNELSKYQNIENITIINHMNNDNYDKIFHDNIIFLDTYDTVCNNVVLECIANHTPLLVNYNVSTVEYLGEDYPFYCTNAYDATHKLNDFKLIKMTHNYLKELCETGIYKYNVFNMKLNNIIYDNA